MKQYSNAALSRSHRPPTQRPYIEYRPCLRLDFKYTCVYCLSREGEIAPLEHFGGFEVEHFKPQGRRAFRRFRNVYKNLLWACHACNRAKRDTWPSAEELAKGYRFCDPSAEGLGLHVTIVGDRVEPANGSPAGEYMIDEINLNSELHRHRRRVRISSEERIATRVATIEGACLALRAQLDGSDLANADLLQRIARLEDELNQLMSETEESPPWDAPAACPCGSLH